MLRRLAQMLHQENLGLTLAILKKYDEELNLIFEESNKSNLMILIYLQRL